MCMKYFTYSFNIKYLIFFLRPSTQNNYSQNMNYGMPTHNFNFSNNSNSNSSQNPFLVNTSFNQNINFSWNGSHTQNGFSSNFL